MNSKNQAPQKNKASQQQTNKGKPSGQQQPKAQQQKPPTQLSNKLKAEKSLDTKYKTQTLFKNILDSPFRITWPAISKLDWNLISQVLASTIKDMPLRDQSIRQKTTNTRKRKASASEPTDQSDGEPVGATAPPAKRAMIQPIEETPLDSKSHAVAKKPETDADLLLVGLNEVTKQLERDNVSVVVVAKHMEPSRIIQHFPIMCALRKVPLCAAPLSNVELGQFFSINTVICFAIKKCERPNKFDSLVQLLSEKSLPLDIPWITDHTRAVAAENVKKFARAAALAQAGDAAVPTPDAEMEALKLKEVTLQPLRTKRTESQKQVPIPINAGKKQKQVKAAPKDDDAMQV